LHGWTFTVGIRQEAPTAKETGMSFEIDMTMVNACGR
jgi:hypothetical protein